MPREPKLLAPQPGWSLIAEGHLLEVEPAAKGFRASARLLVDGETVAGGETVMGGLTLTGGGFVVRVEWGWAGRVVRCYSTRLDNAGRLPPARWDTNRVDFDPPPGSRAAHLEALARRRPRVYATRHVLVAVAQIALGLLALGALFRFVLPAVPWPEWDLPTIPLPDWDLPSLPLPDLPRPDLDLPDWLRAVLEAKKYWLPVLIALFVAAEEVRRRRRKDERANGQPRE